MRALCQFYRGDSGAFLIVTGSDDKIDACYHVIVVEKCEDFLDGLILETSLCSFFF